ncbi:MAG: thiamine pyrophosphate-dependent dehydrogenase E1 component subunit alpha [Polyangiaceae bacterium]|nr:thiamine pyrophosphate-dependent dehydrogenase E1 component subunit alpha [Polyangiaceae bacterium]
MIAVADGAPTDSDLGLFTVLREDGSIDSECDPKIQDATLLEAYRQMRRMRLLDERMILLQRQGRIGFYGACTGQEATPIAAALVLRDSDWVFPALREQAIMLVRGFPLRAFVAQIFGNSGDVLKGRQMPSHQASKAVKHVSWSSCIGPQLPHAVGVAWAMKLRKDPSCTFGFLGDGATSQPDFHAAMTFAGRFNVPAVIVCQNNHWAISLPVAKQTASKTLAIKGRAYGVRSERVDGNDFVALYKVFSEAADRARRGEGPTFVEAVTYRVGAHSTSDDPSRYRTDAEVDAWKKKDPILRLARHLRHLGLITDAFDAKLDEEFAIEIGSVVSEVEALPPPTRESLFDDVYAALPWHLREQLAVLAALPPAPSH